jgi:hypothetical protein
MSTQYPDEIQLIRDGLEGKVRLNENPTKSPGGKTSNRSGAGAQLTGGNLKRTGTEVDAAIRDGIASAGSRRQQVSYLKHGGASFQFIRAVSCVIAGQ